MKRGSQIFELYGYPVDSWSDKAAKNLASCNCPFMGAVCDGGGNRFSSSLNLRQNKGLKKYFPGKKIVQAGVCSLQLHDGEQPWIVCPRRLLNYRGTETSSLQRSVRDALHSHAELNRGEIYSVWSEVKMKCDVSVEGKDSFFDYTFDYIIAGRQRKDMQEVAELFNETVEESCDRLEQNGFTVTYKNGKRYCDDFPTVPFVIVEVMTSSTSGGNKSKRTQIGQLFEDTVRKLNGEDVEPAGPGINYRQVWARMVSQLLVKSQIGMEWGGTTFWILQDQLAGYISKTTALNLQDFLARHKSEVNIISGGYGEHLNPTKRSGEFAEIDDVKLFAGPVSAGKAGDKSFSDIIKLGGVPNVAELWRHLASKKPCASIEA